MIIFLLLSILLVPLFFVRWARWLAILQQKEYRLDRLWAFLKSAEGKSEVKKVLPKKTEFTRTGMKRPHLTSRVLMIAWLSGLALSLKSLAIIWTAGQEVTLRSFIIWSVSFFVLYLFVPISVVIGSLPSGFLYGFITWKTVKEARRKLLEKKPMVIGFGGSYGKTSTKHLVHHFLSQKFSVFVTPRSFNTKFSVAKSICDTYVDQQVALLEYGAYIKGEITDMTNWMPPYMAVETGFTPQHLSLFGSLQNSIEAESELIAALPKEGVVFCNGADPGAVEICKVGAAKSHVKTVMYAGEDAEITLTHVTINKSGHLQANWNGHKLETRLVGKQYLVNLQAAILISLQMGLTEKEVIDAIHSFRPNSSFIQGHVLQTGAYLIDDGGTSNPMGFAAALNLLDELSYDRKVLITAGMIDLGDETHSIHLELAKKAEKIGLQVIHLGIDGKSEFEAVFGAQLITDPQQALEIVNESDKGTVLLLEGKLPTVIEERLDRLAKKAT